MSSVTGGVELSRRYESLLADFRAGRRVALARVISAVEDGRPGFQALLASLHPLLGRTHRVGITGPPGAGKSTLTAALIRLYRERGETVGVIAVDPSSPFSGGALLGDRIRMNRAATDAGVFIRSMATRGSIGGLAATTRETADVMDAYGFDRLVIETVGVGQAELSIAAAADTTAVVLVPESGDAIQAMKAGLMEVSDAFVVNKADRPGAERLVREVRLMLRLRAGKTAEDSGWKIPVLKTSAENEVGVDGLVETLDRHRAWLSESGELGRRRRSRLASRVRDAVERRLSALAWRERGGEGALEAAMPELVSGEATPYEVAERIVRAVAG